MLTYEELEEIQDYIEAIGKLDVVVTTSQVRLGTGALVVVGFDPSKEVYVLEVPDERTSE